MKKIITVFILLFILSCGSVNADSGRMDRFIETLNKTAIMCGDNTRFDCDNREDEYPTLDIHSPYSRKAILHFRPETEAMLREVSDNWFGLTGSTRVRLFDVNDFIVLVFENGIVIDTGKIACLKKTRRMMVLREGVIPRNSGLSWGRLQRL